MHSMSSPGPGTSLLLSALDGLLRPIARFCLRHGLHIQDLLEASKRSLLQAAADELGEKKNVARLSASTGLQRRDVTRLLEAPSEIPEPLGLVNRIIGQWRYDRKFVDEDGNPKELSLDAGGRGSFVSLVQTVTQDIPPGTVLFELERLGALERTEDSVRLLAPAYVPKENHREGYRMLSRDMAYLIDAVTQNIEQKPKTPNLHATVEFDNIRQDKLHEIREWLLDEGSKFQKKVSAYLASHDVDINPPRRATPAGGKVSFSVFSVTEEEKSDEK